MFICARTSLNVLADRARLIDDPIEKDEQLPDEVFIENLVDMLNGALLAPARPRAPEQYVTYLPTALLTTGRAPAADAARGVVERRHHVPLDVLHPLDHELRDSIAAVHVEPGRRDRG